MLGTLRKQSRSVIIYVLFGVIIVVFVFTFNVASPDAGCGGGGGGRERVLARVADSTIDLSTLHMGLALSADPVPPGSLGDPKAFQAELLYRSTRFARMRGDSRFSGFTPDPRTVSGLKARKVMDDLEETFLVSAEAERLGLAASPEEVRSRIVSEFSGSGGEFKRRSYEDWVRYGLRTSLARFEDFVRREVLREKMIGLLVASVTVSDREARMAAALRKARRNYEYIEVNPTRVAEAFAAAPEGAETYVPGARPSPAEVEAFLRESETEARRYYEEHKEDLGVPARHDVRLIRFSAPSRRVLASIADAETRKGLEESRAAARAKAEKAAADLAGKSGPDLVAAFQAVRSDEATAAGVREARELERIDPALLRAVEDTEPGKVTGVIEGDDAFFLALVLGHTPAVARSFEEVKHTVATKVLLSRKASDGVEKLAAAALAKARENPQASLADVAAAINGAFGDAHPLEARETGDVAGMPDTVSGLLDFDPDALPGIGQSKELAAAARALTMERPVADQVFKVGDSSFVLRLKSASPPTEPTPEEVEAARQAFLPARQQAYYREWYQRLRADAAAKGTLVEYEPFMNMVREEAREHEEALKRAQKKLGAPGGSDSDR